VRESLRTVQWPLKKSGMAGWPTARWKDPDTINVKGGDREILRAGPWGPKDGRLRNPWHCTPCDGEMKKAIVYK
jgi:hypothetical protein